MKIKIFYLNRSLPLEVNPLSSAGKYIGLMFRSSKTKNLLFNFKRNRRHAIHSLFVFCPFLALWLDNKNIVQEYKIIPPFSSCIIPKKPFQRLVEIPISEENNYIINFFRR